VSLTEQQKKLVYELDDSAFVVACPGAGKTRAAVGRYLRRCAEEPRKGVALVSFTNAAIDEVRERCTQQNEQNALRAPHFVGTFDSFIHRFVVSPVYRSVYRTTPRLIQSWSDVKASSFRLGIRAAVPDVQLGWFDFDIAGGATLCPSRIPVTAGMRLRGFLEGSRRQEAENRAGSIYRALLAAGTVPCDVSRFLASAWINDPVIGELIGRLVSDRFSEVMVDEAQDCGEDELGLLDFLRGRAVRVLLVGDLDQSIYEFRRAVPEKVRAFALGLPVQWPLTDNFRSTPAICALNSALRMGSTIDIARGPHASDQTPVQVLSYATPADIAPSILATIDRHGLETRDTMVVSHRTADAMRAVGIGATDPVGNNRVAAVVDAGRKLREGADSRVRLTAVERVASFLVEAAVGDFGHKSVEAVCEEHGIDRRWLRDAALRLSQSLTPDSMAPSEFAAAVRARVNSLDWPAQLTVNASIFRAPTATVWANLTKADVRPALPFSTIHGVKGQQFPAVALVLPSQNNRRSSSGPTALDHWEDNTEGEPRRVLYVGASRAQRLLLLLTPKAQTQRVLSLLTRDTVPFHAV
jgi:DNA helicase-2/ATP-dependent DNA helicase PcrA